jgi:hypothetical protein
MPRRCLTALAVLALFVLAPASASGAIKIYQNSEAATYLGQVKKTKCKLTNNGKHFYAEGRTTNGVYKFEVDIYDFTNFGRTYNIPFGVINPTVNLEGAGQDYSNNYAFPGGNPPPSAGAIKFRKKGAKMGVGVYALPNSDYSQGVALAGAANCDYPGRGR